MHERQDVAENVLGAIKDGGMEVHRGTRHLPAAEPTPNTRMLPPTLPLGDMCRMGTLRTWRRTRRRAFRRTRRRAFRRTQHRTWRRTRP